ncbi:tRNA lysidine(34) synthetase TilS [Nocardioidaceae bacterium]|nr:tRNA lysidine(34) synthetase TilS [Nocardioidaceae bacterium]
MRPAVAGPHPAVAATRLGVRRVLDADLPAPGLPALDGEPGSLPTVVVACSGGPDSTALLAATVHEASRRGVRRARVVAATVDHGLQADSAEVTATTVARAAEIGADETLSSRVVVDAPGVGPEAAARQARYAVLEQVADHVGARLVLLGHTLDDQAETVLLGLTHGAGARALAGMRPGFDRFRRPLLGITREQTVTACAALDLTVWHDPHNHDPGFTRVSVRDRVLPVLERELGPGIAATLARTAAMLRDDVAYLEDAADDAAARLLRPDGGVDVAAADLPPALRRRVLHRAALEAGSPAAELTHEHVLGIDALLVAWRGQAGVDLPGRRRAVRDGDLLRFVRPG